MPGEVFRHIHIAGSEAVDRAIPQADFCLAGQGNDVLPPGAVCQSLNDRGASNGTRRLWPPGARSTPDATLIGPPDIGTVIPPVIRWMLTHIYVSRSSHCADRLEIPPSSKCPDACIPPAIHISLCFTSMSSCSIDGRQSAAVPTSSAPVLTRARVSHGASGFFSLSSHRSTSPSLSIDPVLMPWLTRSSAPAGGAHVPMARTHSGLPTLHDDAPAKHGITVSRRTVRLARRIAGCGNRAKLATEVMIRSRWRRLAWIQWHATVASPVEVIVFADETDIHVAKVGQPGCPEDQRES